MQKDLQKRADASFSEVSYKDGFKYLVRQLGNGISHGQRSENLKVLFLPVNNQFTIRAGEFKHNPVSNPLADERLFSYSCRALIDSPGKQGSRGTIKSLKADLESGSNEWALKLTDLGAPDLIQEKPDYLRVGRAFVKKASVSAFFDGRSQNHVVVEFGAEGSSGFLSLTERMMVRKLSSAMDDLCAVYHTASPKTRG